MQLDFGSAVFASGTVLYLEVSLRPAGSMGGYTSLAPRHQVTSTPYAVQSFNAMNATNAVNATNATNAAQLGGVAASQYVVTTDARMSDARPPAAGSTNYIQNTTSQQASTNFNLGGNRILSNAGGENLFAGVSAGASNTTGIHNTFFGASAGTSNTTGLANSFFGSSSGQANTGGSSNSFFGVQAGSANTTGGNNSFVGASAGVANTTGNSNSFFGSVAGFSNTTGNSNSFFGASAGSSNATGNNNSFFGREAGRFGTTGANNSFFGAFAGQQNTNGNDNSFFGKNAGNQTTTGFQNTIIGAAAGLLNTGGSNNLFVGHSAGFENTTGNNNSFVGTSAGQQNTTGLNNSFFGLGGGSANTTGNNNTLIGSFANVGASNRNFASAIGARSVARIDDTIVLGKEAGTYDGVLRNADQVVMPGSAYVLGTLNASGQFGANIFGGTLGASNAAYLSFTDSNLTPLGYVGDGSSQDENMYLTSYLHDVIIYTQVGGALTATSTGKVIIPAGQGSGFSPALEVAPSVLGGSVIANNLYIRQFSELPSPAHVCWRVSNIGVPALVLTNCTSSLSSVRDKTVMQPFSGGLDIVRHLKPAAFTLKESGTIWVIESISIGLREFGVFLQ